MGREAGSRVETEGPIFSHNRQKVGACSGGEAAGLMCPYVLDSPCCSFHPGHLSSYWIVIVTVP